MSRVGLMEINNFLFEQCLPLILSGYLDAINFWWIYVGFFFFYLKLTCANTSFLFYSLILAITKQKNHLDKITFGFTMISQTDK